MAETNTTLESNDPPIKHSESFFKKQSFCLRELNPIQSRNINGKMVKMQGLSQHFLLRIHHQMREPVQGRDPMKAAAFLSKPMFFSFGFMMVAIDREGAREGQRMKARV